jgi:ABC-type multidrug transport system fused ATPase/permease subunit
MTKQKSKTNPRGFRTLAALTPFLKPYKKQFVLAIFSLLLAASATLAVPFRLGVLDTSVDRSYQKVLNILHPKLMLRR